MPARLPRRKLGWLRFVALLALATLLGLCQLQSIAQETARPADGTTQWTPQLAPRGPVVVVVSVPAQRATVYRNGIRIGSAPVSTGRPGHDTPAGIYTVLEKQREHFSNLYDEAPMPFMQRLTWDGIALHAGALPGRPASHGCIRLPASFAEALYGVTSPGSVVVVSDAPEPAPLLAPAPWGEADASRLTRPEDIIWNPAAAPSGPVSLLLSTHDQMLVVLRNGQLVGRSPVAVDPAWMLRGNVAYVLLEGVLPHPSPLVPSRPARPWMSIQTGAGPSGEPDPPASAGRQPIRIPPAFAAATYDLLTPGTVLVITSEAFSAPSTPQVVLQSEDALKCRKDR